jgi:hypothetical protein
MVVSASLRFLYSFFYRDYIKHIQVFKKEVIRKLLKLFQAIKGMEHCQTCFMEPVLHSSPDRTQQKKRITGQYLFFLSFFFTVVGLELRTFTLSHSTSPIFCDKVSRDRVSSWL